MRLSKIFVALGLVAGLAACGDTVGERAILGGAAGAGTAAAFEGNIATGAALGAAGNVVYCEYYPSRCN